MKIRNGFVSNSSASSFTIYGWTEEDLSNQIAKICPVFKGINISIDEWEFVANLEEHWTGDDYAITSSDHHDEYGIVYGVGKAGSEIDHYMSEGRWEDFEYPEPNEEERKKMDEMAEKINLPKPKIYKGTFWA